ncbi:MAG TPA: bile acid:sodium symporter family protein [Candidatus Pelagibacter bacterium]|jgi:BASS family bile acid:Na+ symporter|nr:bile acid:sodium symporter family protein [Candidatus Pelagibacter bacterium]|tara:strand:+ start:151 stop:1011 length:861 start_codon:yes stop_codon:yes gene_type:complete
MEFVKLVGPAAMFFIMFSIALSIKPSAFVAIVKNPLSFYVGLVSQVIGLPLIGFTLALTIPFPPEVKIGIVLITCLPSAVTSNYITKKLDGNVPLSITLTAVASLLAFITIPFILKIYLLFVFEDFSTEIFNEKLVGASLQIFIIVTLPVIIGVIFNTVFENIAKKIDPIFDKISTILFILIIGIAIFQDLEEIPEYLRFAGIKTVLIFVLGFFMATFLAKLFKLNKADQITITVETVLQNGAMGFVIGALIFDDIKYVMPIAAYALLQYIFLLVYFTYVKKILDK